MAFNDTTGMLSALARGLRAGAGVLSPEVFAQNEQERQRKMLQSEEGKQKMFALIAEGIQSGAIAPDQGMQALTKLNPQMAEQLGAMGMGSSRAATQAQQEQQAYAALAQQYGLPQGTPKELILAEHKARNPSSTKTDNALINLSSPDGRKVTLRRSDQRIDTLLGQGWTQYEKPSKPLVSINNAGETAFSKEFGKTQAQRAGGYLEAGNTAANMEQSLTQLSGLLASGVPTGSLQPAVTGLQGVAADLGIDLSGVAKAAGVDLGRLETKEEFDRVSTALVIDGFEKFKGNLNQQEVKLAIDAFPRLGRGEEGNRLAIASMLASARLAQERAAEAAQLGSGAEMRQFEAKVARAGTQRFEQIRKDILASLPAQKPAQPSGPPPGAAIAESADGRRVYFDGSTWVEF